MSQRPPFSFAISDPPQGGEINYVNTNQSFLLVGLTFVLATSGTLGNRRPNIIISSSAKQVKYVFTAPDVVPAVFLVYITFYQGIETTLRDTYAMRGALADQTRVAAGDTIATHTTTFFDNGSNGDQYSQIIVTTDLNL